MQGRSIIESKPTIHDAGIHSSSIPLRTIATGVFLFRATIGDVEMLKKIQIIR